MIDVSRYFQKFRENAIDHEESEFSCKLMDHACRARARGRTAHDRGSLQKAASNYAADQSRLNIAEQIIGKNGAL